MLSDPEFAADAPRSQLDGFDVERVRLDLERQVLRELSRRFGHLLSAEFPTSNAVRRRWLATAVGFAPDLAPRAFRVSQEAQRILGLEKEVQLYLDEEDGPSACIARTEPGPLHIRVDAAFLVHPDDRVLLFVLGHEMGHHIAHAPNRYREADPHRIYRLFSEGRRAGVREVAAAFCRASELTADRIGLLACQDLDAAVRTFMALSTGKPAPAFAGHEQAYLARCKEHVEQLLRQKNRGEGDTHPEVDVRVFALSAFAESDVYAALTGRGAGSRRLVDIDRILERLTGPSESAHDEGLPPMPPSLVEKAEEEFSSAKQRVTAALRTGFTDLRNAATGVMGDATRRGGRDAVEERPPCRSEHGTIADPALLRDPYVDDLERRFTDLERRFDHNTVSGASQKQAPEPGSGRVEDLERQFAELEARMAARGCSEEPSGDSG